MIWDTSIHPLSFDIVTFFAICHLISLSSGFSGKFYVLLLKRGFRKIGIEADYTEWHQDRKYRNIILQMLSLCKWVEGYQICEDNKPLIRAGDIIFPSPERRREMRNAPEWCITPMTAIQIEQLYEKGLTISSRGFQSPSDLRNYYKNKFGEDSLLLQLRQSIHTDVRNFPIESFSTFVDYFVKKGKKVFFIPDVENPTGQDIFLKFGAEKLIAPSYDYEHRLACAEATKLNVIWIGGVVAPLQFSEARFVSFGLINKDSNICTEEYFSRKGPTVGEQPPWFNEGKYYDWRPSDEVDAHYLIETVSRKFE